MLRFPYLEEPLLDSAPASLAAGSVSRWRPLVPVRVIGPPGDSRLFLRALLDTGSDDTIFPLDLAVMIGTHLSALPAYSIRGRGQAYALNFAAAELEFMNVSFHGQEQMMRLETNTLYRGRKT